jgi:hypothetical protein
MSAAAMEENSFRKGGDSFIPQSFAQEKLKTASGKYFELKTNYETHISQLQQSHDSHCLKMKLFYEEYIKDLKFKAKSHISGQMILHSDLVNDLELKLTNSEKDVERLRDQLSNSRLNHQKESRSLKCLLSSATDNERLLEDQLFNNSVRYECEGVMAGMISITELKAASIKEESNMLLIADRLSSVIAPLCRGVEVTEVMWAHRSLQKASGQQDLQLKTLAMIDNLGAEIARIFEENAATQGIARQCIELERAIVTQYTKLSGLDVPSTDISPDWEDQLSSQFTGGAAIAQEVLERGMIGLKRLCSKQDDVGNKYRITLARQSENILIFEVDACMQALLCKVEIQSAPVMPVPLSMASSSGGRGYGEGEGEGEGEGVVPRCVWCSNTTKSESKSLRPAETPSSSVVDIRSDIKGPNAAYEGESSREFDIAKASSSFKEDPAEEEEESSIDLAEQPCRDSLGRNLDVSLISADQAISGIVEDLSALDVTCAAKPGAPSDINRWGEGEREEVKEIEREEEKSPVTAVIACRGEYASEVEQLEDVVYGLQQDLSAALKRLDEGEQERSAFSETLSAVVKEKRTDIVGEYLAEIHALKEQEVCLRESLETLRASRSKDELYVIASKVMLNTLP